MNYFNTKYVIASVLFSIFCISTIAFSATSFFIIPNSSNSRIHCNYLEIDHNQALCKDDGLEITYDLQNIKELEVIYENKSYTVQEFSPERINKINLINSKKIEGEKAQAQKKQEKTNPSIWNLGMSGDLNSKGVSTFQKSIQQKIELNVGESFLATALVISGFAIFILGSLWYVITAFRVSLWWGLGNIFVPFVSIIFLFVHWKMAIKPFLVSLLGIIVIFSSLYFLPLLGYSTKTVSSSKSTSIVKKNTSTSTFQCNGKIYCSEMKSCNEAKFYLNNCPGTKLDGNHDGVPCEKQWCN